MNKTTIEGMRLEDIARALGITDEPGVSFERQQTRLIEELRARLAFRERCDAVYTEGVSARSFGFGLDANPYLDREKDFAVPWMLGWRAADEQAAVDALVIAATAATRGGTVAPLCTGGEQLREAVAAHAARDLSR